MTSLRLRTAVEREDGIAMLMVVAISFIVFIFIGAMFTAVLNTQVQTRLQGDITTAQAAAEAGINDWVYKLNQTDPVTGQSNWTVFPPAHTQAAATWITLGDAAYKGYINVLADPSKLEIWMTGRYPNTSKGDTRTLKVTVQQSAPPAFGYSMFASKGIDIHHHGSAWLSPLAVTTSVHSNGYINLDYSSQFAVNSLEAVGALTFAKGGGSTPGGSIPATGYNWLDQLNGMCYPGNYPTNPNAYPAANVGGVLSCNSAYRYSGSATVYGTIRAGSVTMNTHGQVLPVSEDSSLNPLNPPVKTELGQPINPQNGDVITGAASIDGTTYTSATAASCSQCNKGWSATGGQISGKLSVTPNYAPPVVPFPPLNYAQTYRTRPGVHIFASSTAFFSYITNVSSGLYRMVCDGTSGCGSLGDLIAYPGGSKAPHVIFLDGDWYIDSGSLSFDWGSIKSLVNAATHSTGPAPIIIIRGSIVVPGGSIDLQSGVIVVGRNNATNFLYFNSAGGLRWPNLVDTTKLLSASATEPGVVAAGGAINSSDYDTDSNWTDPTKYEPLKATPIYVRGLVYAAKWDATNKVSVPQNMHWHNYDPKNIIKIYGAQVGGWLHDCNNFAFVYDPLVQKAFGFSSGGRVTIIDYQEIGR